MISNGRFGKSFWRKSGLIWELKDKKKLAKEAGREEEIQVEENMFTDTQQWKK